MRHDRWPDKTRRATPEVFLPGSPSCESKSARQEANNGSMRMMTPLHTQASCYISHLILGMAVAMREWHGEWIGGQTHNLGKGGLASASTQAYGSASGPGAADLDFHSCILYACLPTCNCASPPPPDHTPGHLPRRETDAASLLGDDVQGLQVTGSQ